MNKINSNPIGNKARIAFVTVSILLAFVFIFSIAFSSKNDAESYNSVSTDSEAELASTANTATYNTETVSTAPVELNTGSPQTIELNSITTETPSEDTIAVSNTNGEEVQPLIYPETSSETREVLPTESSESVYECASELTPKPSASQEVPQNNTSSTLTGRDAIKVITDAFVTDTGGYQEHFTASESVNVFAEDVTNCFTILCGASYNIWGCGTQEAVFNLNKISNSGNTLTFTSGLTSGCCDYIECAIYLDGEEIPYLEFNMNSDDAPQTYTISNLSQHSSMKIVLNNCSGNMNTACFYDFIIE